MSFLIKDEKYNEIAEKVYNSIKKEFESEPAYNEKYLKTEIEPYQGKISTNFPSDKIQKQGSQYICLSVIFIDSVHRTGKNCYPQVFLEECKYVVKEKMMPGQINVTIETSSDDSDEENFDEENSIKNMNLVFKHEYKSYLSDALGLSIN